MMMMRWMFLSVLAAALWLAGCGAPPAQHAEEQSDALRAMPWDSLEQVARGATVTMMMWQGDPLINAYMSDYVGPELKQRYGITLNLISGQGAQVVQTLMGELQTGKEASAIDLMWINGETFFQLRQIAALWGPWTDKLPHARYINFENPFIGIDFQQPIEGYECPWGNVQMAIIYDSLKTPRPPANRAELAAFVKANPGRFTIDNQFTGLTFLKALLIDIAGGGEALSGPFDEDKYKRYSAELWAYWRSLQPYLWKQGRTYPEGVAPMHQLFASGELWFTMSNNDCEVDNKVAQGVFGSTARAYVWEAGTIQNAHYLGIPRLSANKAAAMVTANFMISPEAQLHKMDPAIWGDGTVLDIKRLPAEWQERFRNLPNRRYAPPREAIQAHALMELAPEYMLRLAEDFRREIIQQ
jgi:putative spermidine/putrescine transport system substrate-binding protein